MDSNDHPGVKNDTITKNYSTSRRDEKGEKGMGSMANDNNVDVREVRKAQVNT
jgi:hypothetical protein